jgi:hypothetical protein
VRARERRRARAALALLGAASVVIGACSWDPSRPFDRQAPEVDQAIRSLDAGDASFAATTLEEYLSTGACAEGSIGAPSSILAKPNGAFDLGLSLFAIGESYGGRFGDEEIEAGSPPDQQKRSAEVDCALRIVRAVAQDLAVPIEVRARARYLEGNLLFLERSYEDAVHGYDQAIELIPGAPADASLDQTGSDAAWNRAIALRRIDDKKDAGSDGGKDGGGDSGPSDGGQPDSGDQDAGHDGGSPDGGGDGGKNQPDAGQDGGQPPPQNDDAGAPPPPPKASQDERMLDDLENAPSLQQEEAKREAAKHHVVRGMVDK